MVHCPPFLSDSCPLLLLKGQVQWLQPSLQPTKRLGDRNYFLPALATSVIKWFIQRMCWAISLSLNFPALFKQRLSNRQKQIVDQIFERQNGRTGEWIWPFYILSPQYPLSHVYREFFKKLFLTISSGKV